MTFRPFAFSALFRRRNADIGFLGNIGRGGHFHQFGDVLERVTHRHLKQEVAVAAIPPASARPGIPDFAQVILAVQVLAEAVRILMQETRAISLALILVEAAPAGGSKKSGIPFPCPWHNPRSCNQT